MVIHGYTWQYMAIHGNTLLYFEILGYTWLHMCYHALLKKLLWYTLISVLKVHTHVLHDIPLTKIRCWALRSAFGVREKYPCRRMCPTTWTDSKWRPVSSKRDGCLMPNLIGTCFCGAKNGKKTCYRILDCREMGVEVLEVTITWTIRAWRYTALHRVYMRKTAI